MLPGKYVIKEYANTWTKICYRSFNLSSQMPNHSSQNTHSGKVSKTEIPAAPIIWFSKHKYFCVLAELFAALAVAIFDSPPSRALTHFLPAPECFYVHHNINNKISSCVECPEFYCFMRVHKNLYDVCGCSLDGKG